MSDASPLYERVESLLRNPRPFRDWLNAQPDHANVGLPRSDSCNPLAAFLQECTSRVIYVNNADVYYDVESDYEIACSVSPPPWAQRFMAEIDRGVLPGRCVTAAEARWCLRFVLDAQKRER